MTANGDVVGFDYTLYAYNDYTVRNRFAESALRKVARRTKNRRIINVK